MPSMKFSAPYYYTLDKQGIPRPGSDMLEWARWMSTNRNNLSTKKVIKGLLVSTIFLGIDHNFCFLDGLHSPLLWETMIFRRGGLSGSTIYQERYSTKEEADLGHKKACELAKLGVDHILSLEELEE